MEITGGTGEDCSCCVYEGEGEEGLYTSVLNNIESPRTLSFRASIYPHPWSR